ncbi:hypothetical protein [Pseudonocardia acidicola]|uniref:DUF485 domain-containing protein n=1 Tax=Pseudonocardia acidicola TaxID=2724939 RepID=A0ABX1S6E0_9PSEU|nr:hypothetical protein [Pseudonocardia acidicola]
MTRQRRVAVSSPQTRVALAARRNGPLNPPRLTPAELQRAERIRRIQLRRAVVALLAAGTFLIGVPLVLDALPQLQAVRIAGAPLPWLVVAVLPYPTLAGLAFWQLHRAEQAERADDSAPGEPG